MILRCLQRGSSLYLLHNKKGRDMNSKNIVLTMLITMTSLSCANNLEQGVSADKVTASAASVLMSPDKLEEEAKAQVAKITDAQFIENRGNGKKALLLDVRTEGEYKAGHIQGAVWVPRGALEFVIQDITKDPETDIVMYCRSGGRSALSVQALTKMGYKNVLNLVGGFESWVNGGNSIYSMHGEVKVVAFEKPEDPVKAKAMEDAKKSLEVKKVKK